ncbi:MAG: hypothetical protein SF029_15675 [bacterium]|nr:hypothetical protein [bacterium]
MVTIRRVDVGSAFRVSAIITTLFYLVFGLVIILFPSIFLTASLVGSTSLDPSMVSFSAGSLLIGYLCGVPIYAIIGGIIGGLYALMYNLVSGWVGGIKVELDTSLMEKSKNNWERSTFGGDF